MTAIAYRAGTMASLAGANIYHRFMAVLGAHPKTTVLWALGAGAAIGLALR